MARSLPAGMPVPHAFGARTGGSMIILGVVKMMLAIHFGSPMLVLLDNYVESVPGVPPIFAGAELARACRHQRERNA